MKVFVSGILTGNIICLIAVMLFPLLLKDPELKDVKVTQVSGEKITHTGFNYTGSSISFGTEAAGKGVIFTEIPKTNIPEVKAWLKNNNAVMLELIIIDHRVYGLSYLKRWNNFSAGGGVLVSEEKFEGVKVQAQYWFSL